MIKIGEYVSWRQPEVAAILQKWILRARIMTLSFGEWERIMKQRPMPGRGGLLPGEKAV
jgi:hypothetical protein